MRLPFRSYRDAERDALSPLLEAALALHPDHVPAFVEDLRRDAPTVAARLADLLARVAHPAPAPLAPAATPVRMPTMADIAAVLTAPVPATPVQATPVQATPVRTAPVPRANVAATASSPSATPAFAV
jgi:hypothetical protein